MTTVEFIQNYKGFIKDSSVEHPYYCFGAICMGIEFLGKCIDDIHDFNYYTRETPRRNFNSAINLLMSKYSAINKDFDLYSNLRNGFLHRLLPSRNIWLRQRYNSQYGHLSVHDILNDKRVVIIIEDLADDFELACNEVIRLVEIGKLTHTKMKMDILATSE